MPAACPPHRLGWKPKILPTLTSSHPPVSAASLQHPPPPHTPGLLCGLSGGEKEEQRLEISFLLIMQTSLQYSF